MTLDTALLTVGPEAPAIVAPAVDIVIPVFNEEGDLEASVRRLHRYLSTRFPLTWLITIADNASTDRTWGIACGLAGGLAGVRAVHLDQKGRGLALRTAWLASDSPVVAYMDVDLSTDLDALLPLVAPLVSGHSHVAIGTRLGAGARVLRGPKREVISRCYNLILRATLRSGFSDAQCGFKAIRADAARALLPLVEDQAWFFDTELLVLAERNGLRIHEVPVDWVDDPDSRVQLVSTARADLHGIWRLVRRIAGGRASLSPPGSSPPVPPPPPGLAEQLARFASIGVVSTIVFAALFLTLAPLMDAALADVVSLVACAVANTAANRRLTFSLRGRAGRARHITAGLAVAVLPLALNLAALATLEGAGATSRLAQLACLTVVNGASALARLILLRRFVFR